MMRARDAWLAPCAIVLGALALATPVLCRAEAYGPADPQLTFLIGLVVGLPIALACVLGEVILPRRLLPDWLTIAAALAAVAALGLAAHARCARRLDRPCSPPCGSCCPYARPSPCAAPCPGPGCASRPAGC
jgi:hypothetical protein